MKNLITTLFLVFLFTSAVNGQGDLIEETIFHEGLTRRYILYIPEAYNGAEEWPLVINMHPYASWPEQQIILSDMNAVADTGHFLIVYPEGTLFFSTNPVVDPQGYGWNNGLPSDTSLYTLQAVDDVDFISKLIDSISEEYKVDPARVYATGYSNGGVMSHVLACELSDRIAAIAPVAATSHPSRPCTPGRKVPVLQIHGTADSITKYATGNAEIRTGATEFLDFWIDFNACDPDPDVTAFPDIVTSDNSTVELHSWNNCGAELIHYKVINGGHTWPGFNYYFPRLGNLNLDVIASAEIWNFFKRNPHPSISVCPGDIELNTQEEVNNFNCSAVAGSLIIEGVDINDLSTLSELDSVGGNLIIAGNDVLTNLGGLHNLTKVEGDLSIGKTWPTSGNPVLTNIDGLANLASVQGDVMVVGNPILSNIDGLSNLSYIGGGVSIGERDFWIYGGNPSLTNIDGLANLVSVEGDLRIVGNDALTDLNGLVNLVSVEGDLGIIGNSGLTDLNELINLIYVGGELTIVDNDGITKLDGLHNLTSGVNAMTISDNAALTDINGLSNLTSDVEHFWIENNASLTNLDGLENLNLSFFDGTITIRDNASLTNLDGLAKLESMSGDLVINSNPALTNLDGLSNLVSVGWDLFIENNDVLAKCCGIYSLLCTDPPDCTADGVGGIIHISGNPLACNGVLEIISHGPCIPVSVLDPASGPFTVYPNPCLDILHIEIPDGYHSIFLQNIFGEVFQADVSKAGERLDLDLAGYPAGTYLLIIMDAHQKMCTRKVIILRGM